jgi:hypothetical protein
MNSRISWEDARAATRKLLANCRVNDGAGYDSCEGVNSRVCSARTLIPCRLARLVVTQTLKLSPRSVRRLLQIPKARIPRGIAHFLSTLLPAPQLEPCESGDFVSAFAISTLLDEPVAAV